MAYTLLVISAWGSLFLPLPKWAKFLLSFLFVFLGSVLFLLGLFGTYWDSHMPLGESKATSTLITGILLLLSRALIVITMILHVLVAPPPP